jgi:nucleotide-binding universal stress UspA family protein
MYEEILLPTDGSEGTSAAVDRAIDLARTTGARLHVLFAVNPNVGVDAAMIGALDAMEETGREAVADVVSAAEAAGLDRVEEHLVQGTPYRAIVEFAAENDVDLIVMGTHGRRGVDRYLLGSVTEKVIRASPVPVLSVPFAAAEGDETEADGRDGA